MPTNNLVLNKTFPIYNSDGTSCHNLVIHRATITTNVMGLGDKLSGDAYYIDNSIEFSMDEYVLVDGIEYKIINPPTITREGLVTDNSELKGMTKYSFEFYHPMYILSNIPFSDNATNENEENYLSYSKTFSWIGNLDDFKEKVNQSLDGTEWFVYIDDEVSSDVRNEISEVLTFENNMISDALKVGYETWKEPFVVLSINAGEYEHTVGGETIDYYDEGKRFVVLFGIPSGNVYRVDENGNYYLPLTPFTFQMGKGVGLKNNSRTPRNNKIVTRISGYGSEDNVPYGYPQIIWYGDQTWEYTINNTSGVQTITIDGEDVSAMSYPIYDGIVGGQYVKLINHPFTRVHIMPSVYRETLFNKISPYLESGASNPDFDPRIELIDYYDAINDSSYTFPNPIDVNAPCYEIHEFGDIKPKIDTTLSIVGIAPYNDKGDYITVDDFKLEMYKMYGAGANYVEKTQIAIVNQYILNGDYTTKGASEATYRWSIEQLDSTFVRVVFYSYVLQGSTYVQHYGFIRKILIPNQTPSVTWDDTMDEDGNYLQSFFKLTLPALGFDLYACASITQEMSIYMRSGDCIGCTFGVQVDWDDYKANFYDVDGNFSPSGTQRDTDKYPDSTNQAITLIVQKDNTTFGTLMPNKYQKPSTGDNFAILGISLPETYISTAEARLDIAMKDFMLENNSYYFDYPLKFDDNFLANNPYILRQIKPNNVITFNFANETLSLYVKSITTKYGDGVLPKYDITLTDNIEVTLNPIGQTVDMVLKVQDGVEEIRKEEKKVVHSRRVTSSSNARMGKNYFYMGNWEDFVGENETNTFEVNDRETVYFRKLVSVSNYSSDSTTISGDNEVYEYYVFIGANGTYDTSITPPQEGVPIWEKMQGDVKFIITEALFSNYARLGSWIFNGDYMFSNQGLNSNNVTTSYDDGAKFYGNEDSANTYTPNLYMDAYSGLIHANKGSVGGFVLGTSFIGSYDDNYMTGAKLYTEGFIKLGLTGGALTYGGTLAIEAYGGMNIRTLYNSSGGARNILLQAGEQGTTITLVAYATNTKIQLQGETHINTNSTYSNGFFVEVNNNMFIDGLSPLSYEETSVDGTQVFLDEFGYVRIGDYAYRQECVTNDGTYIELNNTTKKVILTATSETDVVLPYSPIEGQEVWLRNATSHRVNVDAGINSINGNGASFSSTNWQIYVYSDGVWYYGYMVNS